MIVYDNYYSNANIQNENDVRNLIIQDSVSQKDSCPVEMGHLISFVARMKHYGVNSVLFFHDATRYNEMINDANSYKYENEMLMEAYEKCKRDTGTTLDFDSWRRTISEYAVSKNNEGRYQYGETIAEAVEDVYLNGYSAKAASRYIVDVLKSKLKG